jgi:hypothetical protein
MLGPMTRRTKVLIGAAVACALYIVMTHEGSDEVELTHAGSTDAPRPQHAPTGAMIRKPTGAGSMVHTVMNRLAPETEAASLFAPHSWYVAPPPPPPAAAAIPQAPPPPQAPPLPFTFMGSYKMDDSTPVFYLTAGDRVFDVKIGDTLDNTYSVDGVQGGQLLFTYMPLKIQQSLAVGEVQ